MLGGCEPVDKFWICTFDTGVTVMFSAVDGENQLIRSNSPADRPRDPIRCTVESDAASNAEPLNANESRTSWVVSVPIDDPAATKTPPANANTFNPRMWNPAPSHLRPAFPSGGARTDVADIFINFAAARCF